MSMELTSMDIMSENMLLWVTTVTSCSIVADIPTPAAENEAVREEWTKVASFLVRLTDTDRSNKIEDSYSTGLSVLTEC